MNKVSKLILVGLCLTTVFGCSNEKKSSGSSDGTSFHLIRRGFQDVRPPANELWMWKEYEKMTGVKVDFEEIPTDSLLERKNVLLSSKNQPDAYYQVNFGGDELTKYGGQGLFIPLEDLIEKHMPNLSRIFNEQPDIKAALTQSDGHIYSLPYIADGLNAKTFYINKKWCDNLGLKVPTTTDELYKVLKAFVTQDPNGNGKKDEQGYYNATPNLGNNFERMIMGAYGLGNGGDNANGHMFYISKDNKEVKMTWTDPRYKEVLEYEAKLYKEGLISPEIFGNTTKEKWYSDAANDIVGSYTAGGAVDDIGEKTINYVGMNAITGPYGDRAATAYPKISPSGMVITRANKNPEKLLEWADFWYSPEGTQMGAFGKEGVTYTVQPDGKRLFVDAILKYKDGVQLGTFQWVDNVYGGGYPYQEPKKEDVAELRGKTIQSMYQWADDQAHAPSNFPSVILGDLPSKTDEIAALTPIENDIGKYVMEMRVKFVTGEVDVDKEWDNFVSTINKMGAAKFIEVKQTQYDRYLQALKS